MQLLTERQALGYPMWQAAFSILMMQDLAVVPIFILPSMLAGGTGAGQLHFGDAAHGELLQQERQRRIAVVQDQEPASL